MAFSLYGFIKGLLIQDESDKTKQLSVEISPSATTGTRTTLIAAQTANRTLTLPDSTDVLSTATSTETLENKTIDTGSNTITNLANFNIATDAAISALKIADGSVSNAEFQSLDGVTSNIQAQLNNGANATAIVQANLDNHVNDTTGAHAGSAISNTPAGNVTSTDVQSAVNELQTHIDAISSGTSTASNLGSGTGLFASKVTNDLQFKSLVAGTNITLSNTGTEVTINATVPASGANTTLSNLTSPTAINQNLIPNGTIDIGATATPFSALHLSGSITAETASTFTIKSADNNSSGTADMNLRSGNSTGHASGQVELQSGTSTILSGNAIVATGSSAGGQTGDVQVNSGAVSSGSSATGRVLIGTGNNSGSNSSGAVQITSGTSTSSNSGTISLTTGNSATSGLVTITTGNSSVGNGGAIQLVSGNASTSGQNGGNIQLTTGTGGTGGRQGLIVLSGPVCYSDATFTSISNPTNKLAANLNSIAIVTNTTAATINGIAAGTEGQHLYLYLSGSANMTLTNNSGSAAIGDTILTLNGSNITTTGPGMVHLIYLLSNWVVVSSNL